MVMQVYYKRTKWIMYCKLTERSVNTNTNSLWYSTFLSHRKSNIDHQNLKLETGPSNIENLKLEFEARTSKFKTGASNNPQSKYEARTKKFEHRTLKVENKFVTFPTCLYHLELPTYFICFAFELQD